MGNFKDRLITIEELLASLFLLIVLFVSYLTYDSIKYEILNWQVKDSIVIINPVVNGEPTGVATGVILDNKKGLVLTNNHVVLRTNDFIVRNLEGGTRGHTLKKGNLVKDLAIIKVDNIESLKGKEVKISKNDYIRDGTKVFAIGHPLGILYNMSTGIVSSVQGIRMFTTVPINQGNSGGALFNEQGEMIGLVNAIISRDKTNPMFNGVSIAIHIETIKEFIKEYRGDK